MVGYRLVDDIACSMKTVYQKRAGAKLNWEKENTLGLARCPIDLHCEGVVAYQVGRMELLF